MSDGADTMIAATARTVIGAIRVADREVVRMTGARTRVALPRVQGRDLARPRHRAIRVGAIVGDSAAGATHDSSGRFRESCPFCLLDDLEFDELPDRMRLSQSDSNRNNGKSIA